MKENEAASSFYIIQEGTVVITKEGKEIRKMTKNSSFGEMGILKENQIRSMSVVADENVKVLALSRDVLKSLLGEKVEVVCYRNMFKWSLEKTKGLK